MGAYKKLYLTCVRHQSLSNQAEPREVIYRSRSIKSHSKLRAAIGLRVAFIKFLLHQNSSLCTVIFVEKVLTLAKSRGYSVLNVNSIGL